MAFDESGVLLGLVMLYLKKERQSMSPTVPLTSRVVHALRDSSHPALRRLSVEENDTRVVITGRVSSYYLKQMAQEAVMPIRGEKDVVNQVLVERE